MLKNILFFGILATLCLPLVQQLFRPFELKPLSGAYTLPETVPLNAGTWFSGSFQDHYSPHHEYQIGFRPFFVRLRNELTYRIYGKSTSYVVLGEENQLFAYNYWETMQDFSFIGMDSITGKVQSLLELKSQLDSMEIPMLVVVGPNKVRYMPEYLPEGLKGKGDPDNYQVYVPALQEAGIPVVDFNEVFSMLKPEYGKKMFPNTGTHWNGYGMLMGLDSILNFTAQYRQDIRLLNLKGPLEADSTLPSDLDLSNDLNLLFPVTLEKNLFGRTNISESGRKAKLFVIGDSFFWNFYQLDEFYATVDSSSHFWYYNNSRILFTGEHIPVQEYNPVEVARQSDAVIILGTEANLHLLPYGFPGTFEEALRQ